MSGRTLDELRAALAEAMAELERVKRDPLLRDDAMRSVAYWRRQIARQS